MFDYSTIDLPGMLQRAYDQMSPSQRAGVGHARTYKRHIFRATMGLGKTFEMLTCVLCFKPQVCLIVVSGKNAINTWRQELKNWFPELGDDSLFNHIRGQPAERKAKWCRSDCIFYIVTAGSFIRDIDWLLRAGFKPSCVVVDEPHKMGLRNRKSAGFKAIKAITAPKYNIALKFIGMTSGTLTAKGGSQLWTYLHIMDPKLFAGYWPFINKFYHVVQGPFAREIGGPRHPEAFARVMAPYIYTVPDEVAEKELPPLRRIPLLTSLGPKLSKLYNSMSEELYMELDGEVLSVSGVLASMTKLRQLVACPAIIDPSLGAGRTIEACCEKILETDDDVPRRLHNVIFTPFVGAIDHYRNYCHSTFGIPLSKIHVLKGGDEPEHVQNVETMFRNDPQSMVICSIAFSQSFNLETAFNMYFPQFSWDQDENSQAEGRGRRRTSDKGRTINAYYVSIPGSITEDMIDVLNGKVSLNNLTYKGVQMLRDRLKQKLEESDDD